MRHKPKVWMKHDIKIKGEAVGYLQLVKYMLGNATSHIEYHINEPYRNKGLMSKELPKYLKMCKKHDSPSDDKWRSNRLIAIIENGNDISKKLLSRNGFIKVKDFDNHISYITHLDINIALIEKTTNAFYKQRKEHEAFMNRSSSGNNAIST